MLAFVSTDGLVMCRTLRSKAQLPNDVNSVETRWTSIYTFYITFI